MRRQVAELEKSWREQDLIITKLRESLGEALKVAQSEHDAKVKMLDESLRQPPPPSPPSIDETDSDPAVDTQREVVLMLQRALMQSACHARCVAATAWTYEKIERHATEIALWQKERYRAMYYDAAFEQDGMPSYDQDKHAARKPIDPDIANPVDVAPERQPEVTEPFLELARESPDALPARLGDETRDFSMIAWPRSFRPFLGALSL